MLLTHRCRPPICISQWYRTVRRRYATGTDGIQESPATKRGDPEWFQKLRKEMLERKLPPLHDEPTQSQEDALAAALSPYLPYGFETRHRSATLKNGTAPPHSIGNHFVFFNPKVAPDELLPDGTDSLHSPGYPFVRRVWAGGSVKVNLASYFQPVKARGWDLNRPLTCVERIKEVTLRNSAAETKIMVTIERRYEKTSAVQHSTGVVEGKGPSVMPQTSEQHVRPGEEWGDAVLVEERNLVFMREISKAKLEAVNNGQVEPKYLRAPKEAVVSHTMTPTKNLLSRFSSLTSNAHAIHLHRYYCRTVEGHRNLLVHGPLTAMLILKFMGSYLDRLGGRQQRIIRSFQYRNLAPLYCDDELRLCAARKDAPMQRKGDLTFDVWIEGPTGGTAVIGRIVAGFLPQTIDPTPSNWRYKEPPAISRDRELFPAGKMNMDMQQHTKQTVEQLDSERDAAPSVLPETLIASKSQESEESYIAKEMHMEQSDSLLSGLIRKYHAAVDVEVEKAQQAKLRSRFLKRGVKRILQGYPATRLIRSSIDRRTNRGPSQQKLFARELEELQREFAIK